MNKIKGTNNTQAPRTGTINKQHIHFTMLTCIQKPKFHISHLKSHFLYEVGAFTINGFISSII